MCRSLASRFALTPDGTDAALHVLRWSDSVGELARIVPAAALTLRNASLIWLLARGAEYWLLRLPAEPTPAMVVTAQVHGLTLTCPLPLDRPPLERDLRCQVV